MSLFTEYIIWGILRTLWRKYLTSNSADIYNGMDNIMETLDNIGIKLFVLAALT